MSIPSTLISCFIGLVSCGDMVLSDSEIIVAHRSRSAQGRVHFITTVHRVNKDNIWVLSSDQRDSILTNEFFIRSHPV